MSVAVDPDRYLTLASISEGLAVACENRYALWRIDQPGAAIRGRNITEADMPLDSKPLDTDHVLVSFFRRASQWTYSLGKRYVEDEMTTADASAIGAFAMSQDWPKNTAELMGYDVVGTSHQLGALLLREALIWSGLGWENADAVAASIRFDGLEIESGGPEDDWCVRLMLHMDASVSMPPRFLDTRDSLRRWAAMARNEVVSDADGYMELRRCSGDEAIAQSDADVPVPKFSLAPLPYASNPRWYADEDGVPPRGNHGRLLLPGAHSGAPALTSLLDTAAQLPHTRQHVREVLVTSHARADRLVRAGPRQMPATKWRDRLHRAIMALDGMT